PGPRLPVEGGGEPMALAFLERGRRWRLRWRGCRKPGLAPRDLLVRVLQRLRGEARRVDRHHPRQLRVAALDHRLSDLLRLPPHALDGALSARVTPVEIAPRVIPFRPCAGRRRSGSRSSRLPSRPAAASTRSTSPMVATRAPDPAPTSRSPPAP